MSDIHKCAKFCKVRREGPWRQSGILREREIQATFICVVCGRERPSKFRRIICLEREAATSAALTDLSLRRLAQKLLTASRNKAEVRAGSLIRRLKGVQTEFDIERLAAAAPIRLIYRPSGSGSRLHTIRVLERAALSEIAEPGVEAHRAAVLAQARTSIRHFANPGAVSIREILQSDSADRLDQRVVKALAALAKLVERGDAVPAKAFSAEVLGSSKALLAIRDRLERLVGPLERLGVRDWGGLVIVGGEGRLHLANCEICLAGFRCLGISSEDMMELRSLTVPSGGILVIENLTPFQACLERFGREGHALLVWSGGFPNRGLKKLLEHAAHQEAEIRVWCDLDLGGVRIARFIDSITGGISKPILMDGGTLNESGMRSPLSPENATRIRRDLEQRPDALLADTLRAILANKSWLEQEALLAGNVRVLPQLAELFATAPYF